MRQNRLGLWALVVVAGALVGCADKPPVDMVATGQVGVRTVQSEKVELPPPSVIDREGIVVISGVIQRKPEVDEPINGHLKLAMLNEAGEEIASLHLPWQPKEIPTAGGRSATYKVNYGWHPPKGTTIVITYYDSPDFSDAAQRASGGKGGGGGGGGGNGGVIRSPGAGERTGRGGRR